MSVKTIIFCCGSGGRAALCGKALLDLGYTDVRYMGDLQDWLAADSANGT